MAAPYSRHQIVVVRHGREHIISYGQVQGLPRTTQRREQVRSVWDGDCPDLHITIPHEELRRVEWEEEFIHLPEKQYFFLIVLSEVKDPVYVAKLLHD